MTENKRVKIAYLVTLVVLFLQVIDVFFLHNENSVFSTNIIARIIGIVVSIIISSVMGLNLRKFCFKSYGSFFEIIYGLVFSLVPISIVYLVKYLYFLYRDYENLVLTFKPSGVLNTDDSAKFTVAVVVYILTLLLISVFKEVFYRGFLITQLSGKYGVHKTIWIQSFIYMLSFVPSLAYYWVTGKFEFQGPLMSFFLICGHLFYNFLCGFKWGLFYRVNGTVWMSVTDHFCTDFIITSFFFTQSRLPEKWYIIEIIAIQFISIAVFIPFYWHRDKQNELAAIEYALGQEALKMGIDNYSPSSVRKKIDEIIFQRVNPNSSQVKNYQKNAQNDLEVPLSLDSIKMPSEEDLTLSVRGYEINDSYLNYTTEVFDLDCQPSEKSKEFFDTLVGKAENTKNDSVDKENKEDRSNANNISSLVQNYFTENFDKHTFN